MEIEACRQAITEMVVDASTEEKLRLNARLATIHFSTQMEGNRLTLEQVRSVLLESRPIPNRRQDEQQVRNYARALAYLESLRGAEDGLTDNHVRMIHSLTSSGKEKPSSWRDSAGYIRNEAMGKIEYMAPDSGDVAVLMRALLHWINSEVDSNLLPVPIITAVSHHQFITIRPFNDGNARTARLLTNFVMNHAGYGLKGLYSLEESHTRSTNTYRQFLHAGMPQNYYEGRAETDISNWIEFFCLEVAHAFAEARSKAMDAAVQNRPDPQSTATRLAIKPDRRQRQVLRLFDVEPYVTTKQIADLLGIHRRTALNLCKVWVRDGFLIQYGEALKSRKYRLAVDEQPVPEHDEPEQSPE
jgi:Fic family protein